jgi:hypothetical protein
MGRLLGDAGLSPQKTPGARKRRETMGRRSWRRKRKIHPAENAGWGGRSSPQADPFAPLEAFGVNRSERGRKSRPAPFGMTVGTARDTQPLQAGLTCVAPPALESGWRDELAATKAGALADSRGARCIVPVWRALRTSRLTKARRYKGVLRMALS